MHPFTLILVLCAVTHQILAGNILFLPMHYSASHKKSLLPIAERLGNRGHRVTMWNSFLKSQPIKSKHVDDVEVIIKSKDPVLNDQFLYENTTDLIDAWNSVDVSPKMDYDLWVPSVEFCRLTVEQHAESIRQLVLSSHWDLVVLDPLFSPCGYVITYLLSELRSVPYIIASTTYNLPTNQRHRRVPEPVADAFNIEWSHDSQKLYDRLRHTWNWKFIDRVIDLLTNHWISNVLDSSKMESNFRLQAGNINVFRNFDYDRVDKNALLSLHMFPRAFDIARPSVVDEIRADDMACPQNLPRLPNQLENFVSHPASKGTIVIAFGHLVNWATIPVEIVRAFLDTFDHFREYRFIWQYNGPESKLAGFGSGSGSKKSPVNEGLKNVVHSHWIPQPSALAHNKTILFVCHMGLKSLLDGICGRVRFVALPIYAEQPLNARLIVDKWHLGLGVWKRNLTSQNIIAAIENTLKEPKYSKSIPKMADRLGDTMLGKDHKDSLDVAVDWVEYAMKHRQHMNILAIRGRRLNLVQLYSLDVVGSVTLVLVILSLLLIQLVFTFGHFK